MTEHDLDMPWLPADADEAFDPLAHADIAPSTDTPIVVTPRGGAREVGRSCYQVDTEHATYLVDCGLNQGRGDQFPDFRGLKPEDIGAVFLTHAHIDHSGGLPVLEARGLFADDAPIIATPPTAAIARTLLLDSLKIHRRESQQSGRVQEFVEKDVEAVLDRFVTTDYGGGRVEALADVPEMEPLVFQLGNAAHLLGSTWLMLQTNGHRAVFSGDLGNRATHLPDMTPPPEADLLVLESTYGSRHSHTAMSDAQTALYRAVERAVQSREPVLIPTFAVGRAQMLLLLFTDRLHTLPGDLQEKVRIVVDGMAQEATDIYHEFVEETTYMDESIVNRVTESGLDTPFLPDETEFPETDADRRTILDDADPATGGKVPIVIAPSGMLTGGNSPRYLTEFAARYGSAQVIFTGYQAKNTTGRVLQDQLRADKDELTYTTTVEPFGTDWPTASEVTWTATEGADPTDRVTRATIPADWISVVDGLSGHAAQSELLDFTRTVGAQTVALIHGPQYAQEHLAEHLAANVTALDQVTRSRLLTPIPVSHDIEIDTPALSPAMFESDSPEYGDQIEQLYEALSALNEEVAAARHETGFDEATIREIVRDELQNAETDGGS